MSVVSIRKLSELGGARRIDAEYYQPSYIEFDVNLSKIPSANLAELCEKINRNPMCYGFNYVASPGIPFFRIDDLYNPFIQKNGVVFVSDEVHHKFFSTALKTGDILMGVRGNSIGRLGIYRGEDYRANISPNLIFFRLFEPKLSNYVATVLLSSVGQMQIQRILAGTGQPTITSDLIKQIRIPTVEDVVAVIDKLTEKAFEEFEKATMSYSHAENLLLEGLGLKDFKLKYELSCTASLSKAFGARRIDAEYFQPIYDKLVQQLATRVELKPLANFLLDSKKGIEVGGEQYQEDGKPFIRVSNLSVDGLIKRDQKYISETLYAKLVGDYRPKMGELLLTKDATPGIAYTLKEPVEGIVSSGILRMTIDESRIDKEYLSLCINSVIGKLQVERDSGGSVITHWKPQQIKRLQIPVLPNEIQQKIASLVRESHEARRKAKELLEEAKRKVEQAIETASTGND